MLDEQALQALKEQHGDVADIVLIDDDGQELQIVLRRPRADRNDPKKDEFFAYWTARAAIEQTGGRVDDPTKDGTAELLRCLVHPDAITVRKHLGNYPGDAGDLGTMLRELAGQSAVADAPELVTEEVKANFHRRAFGFTVAGKPVIARPMSAAEYATFMAKNGGCLYPMRAEALAWAAWSCVQEQADTKKAKPNWDALVATYPMAAILVGIGLLGAAKSKVQDRQKKSVTPSLPPGGNLGTESSEPAAGSSMPSQRAPEAQAAAPGPST